MATIYVSLKLAHQHASFIALQARHFRSRRQSNRLVILQIPEGASRNAGLLSGTHRW